MEENSIQPSARAAKEAGALFYSLPENVTDDMIDPLILPIVKRINESGWVWTAESCQGHPDADELHGWAWNTRPMLRLITSRARYGEMLVALSDSMVDVECPMVPKDPNSPLYFTTLGLDVHPAPKIMIDYAETLIYVKATYTFERNLALIALMRFADALNNTSRQSLSSK